MIGSSNFPYSLSSVTVSAPRRIMALAFSNRMAASATVPASWAAVFTLPEKVLRMEIIITAAVTDRLTLAASFSSGRRRVSTFRRSSNNPSPKDSVFSGICSAPDFGTSGAVISRAAAGTARENTKNRMNIGVNSFIIARVSPVSV